MTKTKKTTFDLLAEIAEENKEVYAEYMSTLTDNSKRVAQELQRVVMRSQGIVAIRWRQGFDVYDEESKFFREFEVKFDKELFPPNEEDSHLEEEFVPAWQLEEFIERGMDVMNLKALTVVEKEVEFVQKAFALLNDMEEGARAAWGRDVEVLIDKTAVNVRVISKKGFW